MAFTTFIDNLALVQVLLVLAAAVFAYGGVMAYWAIRTNDPKGLRSVLRGMAIPLGGVGFVATALALWGEMTWPFLASDGMAGYNIFFFDVLILFGIVLMAYAVSAYLNLRLQYVGLLALVVGGAVAFYGYTGYTASPAFTKDPFDTLLLYVGFATAGILSFPATVIVDYYLGATDALKAPFTSARHSTARLRHFGTRGTQPIVPSSTAVTTVPEEKEASTQYHVPIWAQTLLLLFPVFMGLAAIAALWYFGVTLPGHLGAGAGAAP
ncbi:MAG: DUF981 family protein [Thermoplasmata archaeon]